MLLLHHPQRLEVVDVREGQQNDDVPVILIWFCFVAIYNIILSVICWAAFFSCTSPIRVMLVPLSLPGIDSPLNKWNFVEEVLLPNEHTQARSSKEFIAFRHLAEQRNSAENIRRK